jgi:hypothetical protein
MVSSHKQSSSFSENRLTMIALENNSATSTTALTSQGVESTSVISQETIIASTQMQLASSGTTSFLPIPTLESKADATSTSATTLLHSTQSQAPGTTTEFKTTLSSTTAMTSQSKTVTTNNSTMSLTTTATTAATVTKNTMLFILF